MKKKAIEKKFMMRVAGFLHRRSAHYIRGEHNKRRSEEERSWENLFSENKCFVHKLDENVQVNLYKDSVLSRLIYDDQFECSEISFLKQYLRKGDTFLDIGANIGLFSLLASNIVGETGKIYAFEPTPETFRRLQENLTLNAFKNVEPVQLALSNSAGELSFNVSDEGYDAWNSFVTLEERHQTAKKITVETIELDSFLIKNNIQTSDVKLVKIDVEGWELNVFKGASELLKSPDAPVLMVEFTEINAFAAGYYCGELYDYIEQFGYKWYRYDADQKQMVFDEKKLHYPYDNLFAIKDLAKVESFIAR